MSFADLTPGDLQVRLRLSSSTAPSGGADICYLLSLRVEGTPTASAAVADTPAIAAAAGGAAATVADDSLSEVFAVAMDWGAVPVHATAVRAELTVLRSCCAHGGEPGPLVLSQSAVTFDVLPPPRYAGPCARD